VESHIIDARLRPPGLRVWKFLHETPPPQRRGLHRYGYVVDADQSPALVEHFRSLGVLTWQDEWPDDT
jgi:hypothetical protein